MCTAGVLTCPVVSCCGALACISWLSVRLLGSSTKLLLSVDRLPSRSTARPPAHAASVGTARPAIVVHPFSLFPLFINLFMRWCDGFLKNLHDLVEVDTQIGRGTRVADHLNEGHFLCRIRFVGWMSQRWRQGMDAGEILLEKKRVSATSHTESVQDGSPFACRLWMDIVARLLICCNSKKRLHESFFFLFCRMKSET